VFSRLITYEYSGESEDPSLAGLLDLALRLRNSDAERDAALVQSLLSRYLFFLPSVDEPEKHPIASSEFTRKRCYDLLAELVSRNGYAITDVVLREVRSFLLFSLRRTYLPPPFFSATLFQVEAFCVASTVPLKGPNKWDWAFKPDDYATVVFAHVKHVGLLNQGATCYQNSVLQQLFMRHELRDCILKVGSLCLLLLLQILPV